MTGQFHVRTYVEIYTLGWSEVARHASLQYQDDAGNGYPGVKGMFRGYPLSMTCRGLPKFLKLQLEIAIKNPEMATLSLHPNQIGDSLRGWFGWPRELTGDSEFDKQFALFGTPAGYAQRIFHGSTLRKQMLTLGKFLDLRVRDQILWMKSHPLYAKRDGLQWFATAVNIARAVDEL